MSNKPRPISGNQPFDAIAKDYNRYCDRIVGNELPGGFNPISLSPRAWYDKSDASLLFVDAGITNVTADGQAIYQSNDKSGNGFHLKQTTLAARPTYKTNIQNRLSIARFDGVDDWLMNTSSVINGSTNRTVFMVTRPLAGNASKVIFGLGHSTAPTQAQDANTGEIGTRINGGFVTFNSLPSFINSNIITKKLDGVDCASITARLNSAQLSVSGITNNTLITGDGISISALFNDSSLTIAAGASFQDQDFSELILYDYALSAAQILQVETYLNNKWGVF